VFLPKPHTTQPYKSLFLFAVYGSQQVFNPADSHMRQEGRERHQQALENPSSSSSSTMMIDRAEYEELKRLREEVSRKDETQAQMHKMEDTLRAMQAQMRSINEDRKPQVSEKCAFKEALTYTVSCSLALRAPLSVVQLRPLTYTTIEPGHPHPTADITIRNGVLSMRSIDDGVTSQHPLRHMKEGGPISDRERSFCTTKGPGRKTLPAV